MCVGWRLLPGDGELASTRRVSNRGVHTMVMVGELGNGGVCEMRPAF